VAMHVKFNGNIFEEETFDVYGVPEPSAIPPSVPDDPGLRDLLAQYGGVVLRVLDSLPLEEPYDEPEELVIWGRDEQDRAKVLKILRNAAAGGSAVFPRDFYQEVDQLPLCGPETIFEFRDARKVRYDLTEYGLGDGPKTYLLSDRTVVGVIVRPAVVGEARYLPRSPRLTFVREILDPVTPLCPDASSSWYLPDSEPPAPGDEGELCFDVDALTSMDEYMLPMSGLGLLRLVAPALLELLGLGIELPPFDPFQESFPAVLVPGFDTGPRAPFRGYMAARSLMNRGFRMLDTINPDEGPSIVDVRPLTHGVDFARDYDGVPIEMGFQVRRVYVNGLQGQELLNALGAYSVLDFMPVPLIAGDYRFLVRNTRFYVRTWRGRTEVTLPQLLQLIASRWSKEPAYEGEHNLLDDHPRLDLGQLGPFTFEMRAEARVERRGLGLQFRPIRAIVSAYPGLYSTNHYGGDPFE